ncbi:hypothetical protein ILUMI_21716 [Ignelater luminosus]|uniref:C2H2-type domain-containing protein n=1 Tax=Ignelater luminosus TaxID=2038154 RepID=A0A8K0CBJ2_IGNLU|nr:hypothetical protein ILUMI_21716 [Ignelater luminosus]
MSVSNESSPQAYYFCPKCNKKYQRKITLNRHLKWECGKVPQFCCNICSHRFTYRADFDKHLIRKHKIVASDRSKYSTGFPCIQCGKIYKTLATLKRHLRYECNKEGKFPCPVCHKLFKHKHHLRSHQVIHFPPCDEL